MRMLCHLTARQLLFAAVVLTTALHLPHFPKDVTGRHAWRQAQTQTNVRNFAFRDGRLTHPRVHNLRDGTDLKRMEFPLYQWGAARVHRVLGWHPAVMRLPLFVMMLLTLGGVFCWLRLFLGGRAAALATYAFTFGPTYFYHGFNPLPDNLALCFGVWALYWCERTWREGARSPVQWYRYAPAAVLIALATLVKLPLIMLYAAVGGRALQGAVRGRSPADYAGVALIGLGLIAPVAWYATVIPTWGSNPVLDGVGESGLATAKLIEILRHNLIAVLPEMLLNFLAVPAFLYGLYQLPRQGRAWLHHWPYVVYALGFLAFFALEFPAIGVDHDYYLYPVLPLLFLLVGYGVSNALKFTGWREGGHETVSGGSLPLSLRGCLRRWGSGGQSRWTQFIEQSRWRRYALPALLLLTPLTCYLRNADAWSLTRTEFPPALYAHREDLRALLPPDAHVLVGPDFSPHIQLYFLDRRGWTFSGERPTAEQITRARAGGVTHVVTTGDAEGWWPGLTLIQTYADVRVYRRAEGF